ncbi:hypothetical protein GRF59_26085 [Paenibacillus sp. HJL G12]|uniref:PepSY domain-containing protein n=1 Tax=Paenibacillus dendrobii TaxID=2691084 RepID=A0A7X3IQJ5_9BACL|nr:PepSY domain-containing protein [Paenibacillus dendrobii]MWV47070.1 hypothetical protein [Paenibacillus dendrobii]
MKKITIIALGILLLIGAAGCSSKAADNGQSSNQGTGQNTTQGTDTGTNTNEGTGQDAANNAADHTTPPSSTPSSPEKQTGIDKQGHLDLQKTTFKVTPKEALDIAATKGSGDVTKLEIELENQVYVYKVEMMTDTEKTKVGIHAEDKSIIENKTEKLDQSKVKTDRAQSKIDLTGIIDEQKAMQTATQKVNGTATKWKIERKNGPTYYEVDVHTSTREYEIKIDAKTGKILSLGQDD